VFPRPAKGGHVLQARAVDAAGNVGTATTVVGVRTLSGARGAIRSGPGGTFAWKAPKTGQVTFDARRPLRVDLGPWRVSGVHIRFAARRGRAYRLSVAALPLSRRS
jgi:hypothetical protein